MSRSVVPQTRHVGRSSRSSVGVRLPVSCGDRGYEYNQRDFRRFRLNTITTDSPKPSYIRETTYGWLVSLSLCFSLSAPWNPVEGCLPFAEACQADPECMVCHTVTDREGWNSCTASINSDDGCAAFGQHFCCLDEQSVGDCSTNDRAQAYFSCISEAAGLQCSPWSCVGEANTSGTGTPTVETDSNNAAASCESLTGWNNFVGAAMIVVGFIVTTMGAK